MLRPPVINASRLTVQKNLLSYGEDELASRTRDLADGEMLKIGERGAELLLSRQADRKLYLAVALAAVEVMEGSPRPLRLTRRKLKGISDHCETDEHMTRTVRRPLPGQAASAG
jgi:hypothetical protein